MEYSDVYASSLAHLYMNAMPVPNREDFQE